MLAEAVMALEVEQRLGAAPHERTPERSGQRNGYRELAWDTRVGTVGLRVPRVRDGGYFPALLEPRTRADRTLVGVVQEAYVGGVSTWRVDDPVRDRNGELAEIPARPPADTVESPPIEAIVRGFARGNGSA